ASSSVCSLRPAATIILSNLPSSSKTDIRSVSASLICFSTAAACAGISCAGETVGSSMNANIQETLLTAPPKAKNLNHGEHRGNTKRTEDNFSKAFLKTVLCVLLVVPLCSPWLTCFDIVIGRRSHCPRVGDTVGNAGAAEPGRRDKQSAVARQPRVDFRPPIQMADLL